MNKVFLVLFLIMLASGCIQQEAQMREYNQAGPEENEILSNFNESRAGAILKRPGNDSYAPETLFENPLNLSGENPGPGGCEDVMSCVRFCEKDSAECRDWLQSIYLTLDTGRQVETEKHNGVWLPTIDAVRYAAKKIPQLKEAGVNTVSFGPEVDTRHFDEPRVLGGNLYRFYAKIFEDASFNVHLVPNPMHWGNNDIEIRKLNPILLEWAGEAEKLDVKFYTLMNEFDSMAAGTSDASEWVAEVLPGVRKKYSGLICVQPAQPTFCDVDDPEKQKIDYSGLDCVSAFYPVLIDNMDHYERHMEAFTGEAGNIRNEYPVKYVMFNDVATFYGGNWAETGLIEAEKWGFSKIYVSEEQQARLLGNFLEDVYPEVDGTFLNIWTGFTFLDRQAEPVVKAVYSEAGKITVTEKDYLWATAGFLEMIENAALNWEEKEFIFDLETYSGEATGSAGLCFEPTTEDPGPLGCTSVEKCMETFRSSPEEYWWARTELCG